MLRWIAGCVLPPLWAVVVVLSMGGSASPPAQPALTEIPSEPTCRRCGIVLRRVATLHGTPDSIALDHDLAVARDGRGRFFVAPALPRARAVVYGPDGRYLRTIGGDGEGPGETRFAQFVLPGVGDSVALFDPMLRRVSVFSPELDFIRTLSAPFGMISDAVALPDGGWVVHSRLDSRSRAGLPLHSVSRGWDLLHSFGAQAAVDPAGPFDRARALAPARGGRIWSARRNRYQMELWDADGRHLRTLVRSPRWFAPWHQGNTKPLDVERPNPVVRAVREDSAGRLWVFVSVPDFRWRAGRPSGGRREIGVLPRVEEEPYLDTMIEVLDPVAGRVIARARSTRALAGLAAGDPHLFTSREDESGNEVLEIWHPHLRRPATRR